MNEDLADEVSALNSIYGATCIAPSSSGTYVLRAPTTPELTLTLSFPPSYPQSPPVILDGAGGGGASRKDLARDVLSAVWRAGEVCLYDLVEGLRELEAPLESEEEGPEKQQQQDTEQESEETHQHQHQHPWTVAEPLVEKKSVFVARAIAVHSVEEAKRYVSDLIAGDRKVAKATHNMTGRLQLVLFFLLSLSVLRRRFEAYRICREDGVTMQDNDDDGEAAAGGRIAHLMQVMEVVNVLVVVSRWYGGVKLGPDRWGWGRGGGEIVDLDGGLYTV